MTLQQQIIEELRVLPNIDVQGEIRKSIDFLKEYAKRHSFVKGFVLGISGGQDSTLTGKLAQLAIDELNAEEGEMKYSFFAVRLPYGVQADEQDCQDAIDYIKPTKVYTVNIKDAVDASVRALTNAGVELNDFVKGNEKARERMKVQYSIAAMNGAVVLGTDHAAEAITGFYTKFGDGGADLMPIFRLNKRQGKQLLAELQCPEHLYKKVPTADLEEDRPSLPDEVALGVSYDQIDDYLEGKEIPEEPRRRLEGYYLRSQHKRHMPITIFDDFWK
ncbi:MULTISPECIES: ammonia-dependent NAD(+) synthetase [Lysinibacillus]|uniref:ammonia-dependent NAD(+) synthetase n=1 Tax=Lysinibacillus TaxID=400634 RepID=UPI001C8CB467|nr:MULTISPECIES: ammonia-dependent NAD(+) synthetase [Lysinibacillus]MBX8946470.1 ammonia-dependent NAD(+) synthetase [Lysinibacillus sp. K60]UNT56198.1 ammonia-dependent NAD(+) synthetase [Lysinibacillus capsici]WDU79040.1 ammonia-dependent NAD(+) synthetase [Lysinibacillus sp. G01H]WHP41174.1 ammonia-dependent NAD(+) synthetase [Lysinibacillus boronitolerans]